MKLFTPDLLRNFGIGFAAGAIFVALNNGAELVVAVPQMVAVIL